MKMPKYNTLLYEIEDNVLHITLNRPEKRNALNALMVRELHDIFLQFKDKEYIIGASLTGAGNSFCSGADLSYLKSLADKSYEENLKDSLKLKEMYWTIYNFPKPTVGLINGPAIAGGCGLMTVLDIALASKNAIFGYPEVKIGFIASIVSVFLIQIIGIAQTKKMLYTGELIDVSTAKNMGLIQRVVEEGKLKEASSEFFSQIRNNSPQAVTQTKELLHGYQSGTMEEMLEQACRFNAESRQTNDFKEGIQSFLEKRRPNWVKTQSL
jgi:methylglutaconyl-CoA hydratase